MKRSQRESWNGSSGRNWVAAQGLIDDVYRPIEELLTGAVEPGRVLDVGCGTGGTTVAVARKGSPSLGVDISAPMLAAARERAARAGAASLATFLEADAEDHPFEPGSFDTVISRFGVMFFADAVRAFANLNRATVPGGALRMVVWRRAEDNPFLATPGRAAAPLLPDLASIVQPGAAGPMGMADPDRFAGILRDSGWTGVSIEPADVPCVMPAGELEFYFTHLGPLGSVWPDLDDGMRARLAETVRRAFDPFVEGDEARFTAGLWVATAQTPSSLNR